MTGNDEEVAKIFKLSKDELLDYILESPEYLTDSYYAVFGIAIHKRRLQLKEAEE